VKKTLLFLPAFLVGFISFSFAQNLNNVAGGQIHGNFEVDAQYYNPDSLIGAPAVPEKALMNGFGNINYTNGNFSAGVRYESYLNELQGFPAGYKGSGIPYRFATYNNKGLEITVGSSYDQFGSGLVYRAYEDRGLGYDNALDGIRVRYNPYKGIYLKGIWGKQRAFFSSGAGIVRGFDGEINLNELFDSCFAKSKTQFIVGGCFVSKYQVDDDPFLVLPQNVGAWAGRANIIRNWDVERIDKKTNESKTISQSFNLYGEFAYKINDPSTGNSYIYKPGNAAYVSTTYSRKGLGISFAANRIDNFGFRSDRNATGNSLMINYLPALTKQHTYVLTAFYPYASQPNGQLSWQGEIAYKLKKGTALGGKHGTDVTVNYSTAMGLDTTKLNDAAGRDLGYTSKIFPGDSLFFQDINVEIFREISPRLKGTIVYANMKYNKNVIEGHSGYPIINSHIAVVDIIWKMKKKINFKNKKVGLTLRSDMEHLYTKDDKGSWACLLEELTIGEHCFIAAMDEWNYGNSDPSYRIHYYNAQIGFLPNHTSRITLSYGKQRAGIFCVGGVCRFVPASNGFALTITSSF
jgi:hypothetical protein